MTETSFDVEHEGGAPNTLVVGTSEIGVAGLTAVDYLAEKLEMEKCGQVTTDDLPSITPFEEGVPRHHTRFFGCDEHDFTVLTSELFVPLDAARSFADAVLNWTEKNDVEEVVFLSGVPIPHNPEQHEVHYVATNDYREKRFLEELKPMGGGFLEGLHAEVMARGIDSPLSVGALLTPVHPPAQDVEAAIRLLQAFRNIYGVDVDTAELEEYGDELQQYYEQLSERMSEMQDESKKRLSEDRAYV